MRYNITKTIYKAFFLVVLTVSVSNYVIAADEPEGPSGPETPPEVVNEQVDITTPIDGGVGILVAAGVAFGLKRAYDKRKQNKNSEAA